VPWIALAERVPDGVQQVGLAAPGAAVDEKRVEADLLGRRERPGGGRRDLVCLADDEALEAVARVEIGAAGSRSTEPGFGMSSRISSGAGRVVGGGDDFRTSRTTGRVSSRQAPAARRNASVPSRP
jgi:hypothetical protein